MNLYEKLYQIQGLCVKKDAENPFFKSKYATLDAIIEVLSPMLKEQKLLVYHKSLEGNLVTVLQDTESQDKIESSIKLPELQDPQKLGSAITYFKRYNLGQIFNIVTDEDDDGNVSSGITANQADRFANEFNQTAPKKYDNKAPNKWLNDADFEAFKYKFVAGDNPTQKIKQLRDSGLGVSKAMADLITNYINQL